MLCSFPDELLVHVAVFVREPNELNALMATCRLLRERLQTSRLLWQTLVCSLLTESAVAVHTRAWRGDGSARFYRQLYFSASTCHVLAYANTLREACLPQRSSPRNGHILRATGHTATPAANLIVIIGGWRPDCMLHHLHVSVVDLRGPTLLEPALASSSARPRRRLRHASCAVSRPSWAHRPAGAPDLPCVLVLGGAYDGGPDDEEDSEERGKPIAGGLLTLTLLSFATDDGAVANWEATGVIAQETHADGIAPSSIWHHAAASFANASRVVVFGGDMLEEDLEFEQIRDRRRVGHVYVLSVELVLARCEWQERVWSRVATSGACPSWRSLHVAAAYKEAADGTEHLLVLGGSERHIPAFSSGAVADFKPYLLDLATCEWRTSDPTAGTNGLTPLPRMRFAADVYGSRGLGVAHSFVCRSHLIVYGGHGDGMIPRRQQLLALNLRSLRWHFVHTCNAPSSYPDTPAACLAGGVLVGGVQMPFFGGVRPCDKFDFLCLAEPPQAHGASPNDARDAVEADGLGGGSSAEPSTASALLWEGSACRSAEALSPASSVDDDEEEADDRLSSRMISVQLRSANGSSRTVTLPIQMVASLLESGVLSQVEGDGETDGGAADDSPDYANEGGEATD